MTIPSSSDWRQSPAVVPATEPLPKPKLLARPEAPTLTGYTRRPLHVKGENCLAVFSYSGAGASNWLFLISIADGSVQR